MTPPASDTEAWARYPFHRNWFNKLWLAERLNYLCGPTGVPVPSDGRYVVRPIYNLLGMGSGAKIVELKAGDEWAVPPGYFWCEMFEGEQLSVELEWSFYRWKQLSTFKGENDLSKLYRFNKWAKVDRHITIPKMLNELWDCNRINIELVGNKIIEVHLRSSPDPIEYDEFIPVWSDTAEEVVEELKKTHAFVESPDNVYGENITRIGFFVKRN